MTPSTIPIADGYQARAGDTVWVCRNLDSNLESLILEADEPGLDDDPPEGVWADDELWPRDQVFPTREECARNAFRLLSWRYTELYGQLAESSRHLEILRRVVWGDASEAEVLMNLTTKLPYQANPNKPPPTALDVVDSLSRTYLADETRAINRFRAATTPTKEPQ